MRSELWLLLQSILDATRPPTAVWDEALLLGLKPRTVAAYRRSIASFLVWVSSHGVDLSRVDFLDQAILAFARDTSTSRSEFERLVSAIERILPLARGRLVYAHSISRHWRRALPPRHAAPMSWSAALALSWAMAVAGYPRAGALLLLQAACGLRPSEAIALRGRDLLSSLANRSAPGSAVLHLGVKHGTKVGRPQAFVLAPPSAAGGSLVSDINFIAIAIVDRFASTTALDATLSGITTVQQWRTLLNRAAATMELGNWHFTPHSPRVGWASERKLRGMEFAAIREGGRWMHDQSLRTYLDVTAAVFTSPLGPRSEQAAGWLAGDFCARFPWWLAVPALRL